MKEKIAMPLLLMLLMSTLLPIAFGSTLTAASTSVPIAQKEVSREKTVIVDAFRAKMLEVTNLNPFIPFGGVSMWAEVMVEPMLIYNMENGTLMKWLSTGYEVSDDYTTWTLFLREGVKWNDGEPFTADDVVFTYNMLLDTPELLYHAIVAGIVKEVVKIDDHTVEFRLTSPNPRFHGTAAFPTIAWICQGFPIVPEHIWKDVDPITFKNYPDPVFTGPYTLTSVSETDIIFDRRDDWWGTEVWGKRWAPERIIFSITPTDDTATLRMIQHDLDTLHDIPVASFERLKEENPYAKAWGDEPPYSHFPHGCERYIALNLEGKYPFNLKEVRWALAYFTNQSEIIDIAYEGEGAVSRAIFGQIGAMQHWFDEIPDLLEKYDFWTYDPDKASAIFDDLGFTRGADGIWVTPNGTRLELMVLSPDYMEIRNIGMIWVEQLKDYGIDAVLKVLDPAVYYPKIQIGDYEAGVFWACPAGTFEPFTYLEQIGHSRYYEPVGEDTAGAGWNPVRFKNATFDHWVDIMADHLQTDPEYVEAFRNAYEIWLQELAGIPIALSRKLNVYDWYYWSGWPTKADNYVVPFWWCGYGLRIPLHEKVKPTTIDYEVVYFTNDTPRSYRGIDLNWYGPFEAGDSAKIPDDDAEWYIRTDFASYSPVIPTPEIPELAAIAESISALSTSLDSVKADVGGISGSLTMLTIGIVVEAIAVIVLAVALLRKRPAE